MQRPTGVTILAVLEFIGGVLGLLGACGLLGLGALGGAAGIAGSGGDGSQAAAAGVLGVLGIGLGVVTLVLAIVGIIIGVGLWTLKRWAWNAARILAIINIVFAIISVIATASGGNQSLGAAIGSNIVGILINGFIVWYLNKPEIRGAFVS